MSAATVISSVSTDAIDVVDRLAFWEHYNAEALVGLTCRTYADEGLEASQVNLDLGGIRVADIAGNAHLIERPPALIRSTPKDAVFVSVVMAGEGFFYSGDGCRQLHAGDVVVYATDQPYLLGFSTGMRKVLLDIPRPLFEQRCGAAVLRRPVHVPGLGPAPASLAARALQADLRGLVDDPIISPQALGTTLMDLVHLLTARHDTASGTARLLAAKGYIAEHLAEPGLCVDAVADALGVTARHLNRTFASEGTTVTRYIRAQRLDAARTELVEQGPHGARVADIACRWGFASQAHFARVFRARFDRTPTEVLRQGAGDAG